MVCSCYYSFSVYTDNDPFMSGDWASGVWSSSGVPGQEQSCAQRTGFASCEDFVRASGSAFKEACKLHICSSMMTMTDPLSLDWEVKSVKIYQLA